MENIYFKNKNILLVYINDYNIFNYIDYTIFILFKTN